MRILFLTVFVFFCCLLTGCATIYNPATQQREFILIDTPIEVALGRRVAAQIENQYIINEDPKFTDLVKKVGERIAIVSDRTDLQYNFYVVKDKEVNAFSTPGGYVYVHTGLLEKVNDDELANIIGHEIGHVAARHSVKRLQTDLGYSILMSLAFGGGGQDLARAIGITFDLITLGYSREDEFLADRLGVKYAYKAGYSPNAMVTFLRKLNEMEGREPLAIETFLRSHPLIPQRITNVEKEIIALKSDTPKPTPDKKMKPLNLTSYHQIQIL